MTSFLSATLKLKINCGAVFFMFDLRWEFLKENKKVRKQENALSTKKAIKKRRKQERKHALGQESDQEKTKKR